MDFRLIPSSPSWRASSVGNVFEPAVLPTPPCPSLASPGSVSLSPYTISRDDQTPDKISNWILALLDLKFCLLLVQSVSSMTDSFGTHPPASGISFLEVIFYMMMSGPARGPRSASFRGQRRPSFSLCQPWRRFWSGARAPFR